VEKTNRKSKNSKQTKQKPHQNSPSKNQTKQQGKVNGWSVGNVSN
jgi:hypothetical protein